MRMSKWTLSFLVAILLLSSSAANPKVLASSLTDMKEEMKNLEKKKSEINSGITEKTTEIKTNQSKIDSIRGQIQALDNKVKETNASIKQVEDEIDQTKEEIDELHSSIKQLEKRIEERDLLLKDRVRAMQISGGTVNYLDVLLGANSFSDFIDRFSAVSTLMDADRKIIQQQNDDKEQLEDEKKLVEQKLQKQEEQKDELKRLKASLDSQKNEKAGLVKELEAVQKKLATEKANLEEEFHETHELSKELQAEIAAEQKRAEELARKIAEEKKRKEAEEEKRRAAEAAAAAKSNGGNATASTPTPPAISNGDWTRPASGRISSGFGYRIHPIHKTSRLHAGIDIANSTGTPIIAAADGVVSRASYHSTLGNHIVITHVVNGKTYSTLYAHLSSMAVGQYATVSKGQFIGSMGNTGASTGPHLHFEFHIGTYAGNASAVNPRNYVSF